MSIPTFYKALTKSARNDKSVGYSTVGYHLGIHTGEFVSMEALNELNTIIKPFWPNDDNWREELLQWLKENLGSFIEPVPARRRNTTFLDGFIKAIEDGRVG